LLVLEALRGNLKAGDVLGRTHGAGDVSCWDWIAMWSTRTSMTLLNCWSPVKGGGG
jgi:hypothetical protein